MTGRRALSWVLITVGAVGAVVNVAMRAGGHEIAGTYFDVIPFLGGIALSAILAVKVPGQPMTLLLCAVLCTGTWVDPTTALAVAAAQSGGDILAVALTQTSTAVFLVFSLSLFVLMPLWFPTGHAIGRRWEWVGRIAVFSFSSSLVATVLAGSTCVWSAGDLCQSEVTVPWGLSGVTEDLATLLILPGMTMAIPAVWSLALRLRRAVGIERQQLRFMMPSVILLAGFYVTLLISDAVFGVEFSLTDEVMWVFVSLIVLSYTLAILRYRLYEIDRLVSRTVSYTLLVLSLGMVFALGVVYIPNQLSKDAPPWLVAASTLAVAALFNPLRSRVQSWVDRKFNRARFDAQRVMDDFSATLLEQGDERELVGGWLGVVDQTMQPSALGLWLR